MNALDEIKSEFEFINNIGYVLESIKYNPNEFGDIYLDFHKNGIKIIFTRDRGQSFIDIGFANNLFNIIDLFNFSRINESDRILKINTDYKFLIGLLNRNIEYFETIINDGRKLGDLRDFLNR